MEISKNGHVYALFTEIDYKNVSMNFLDAMRLIQAGKISLSLSVQQDIQGGIIPIGTNFVYASDSYTDGKTRQFTADINFWSIEIILSNTDINVSSGGACSF